MFFFFNDTATTEIYTLSLHDALPISRTNEQITASQVRVISSTGAQLGIISIREALNYAEDEGYDLVEVSPDAKPPVCKIIDYGKLKYKEQKSKKAAKKKQKTIEVKEIKMRPGIDTHDYQVKVKALKKFISGGNKVKVSMRFRGREMEIGRAHV